MAKENSVHSQDVHVIEDGSLKPKVDLKKAISQLAYKKTTKFQRLNSHCWGRGNAETGVNTGRHWDEQLTMYYSYLLPVMAAIFYFYNLPQLHTVLTLVSTRSSTTTMLEFCCFHAGLYRMSKLPDTGCSRMLIARFWGFGQTIGKL